MKILSISGGGVRGLVPARMFEALEAKIGPLWKHFDLIAGTSTGGILALGLALGLPAKNVANFYREDGPKIFKRRLGSYFGIHDAKYDVDVLNERLTARFGDARMQEAKTAVMVTASNLETLDGEFLSSWKNPQLRAAVAGTCTAAAPTYFDPFIGRADGGLFANDPALFALISAVEGRAKTDFRGVPPETSLEGVKVLDIICPSKAATPALKKGLLGFAPRAAEIFIDIGMDTVADACEGLLGSNFLKLRSDLGSASSALDDASAENLTALTVAGDAFAVFAVPQVRRFLEV